MNKTRCLSTWIQVLMALLVLVGVAPAHGESAEEAERKNVLGLYIWAPGLDGVMTVKDESVPIDVAFTELFQDVKYGGAGGSDFTWNSSVIFD